MAVDRVLSSRETHSIRKEGRLISHSTREMPGPGVRMWGILQLGICTRTLPSLLGRKVEGGLVPASRDRVMEEVLLSDAAGYKARAQGRYSHGSVSAYIRVLKRATTPRRKRTQRTATCPLTLNKSPRMTPAMTCVSTGGDIKPRLRAIGFGMMIFSLRAPGNSILTNSSRSRTRSLGQTVALAGRPRQARISACVQV